MPVIASKNFATGTQNYLNLGVDTYCRGLSIGTQWTRIRIGILCSLSTVQDTTYPIRGALLCLGVGNGINSNIGVYKPQHCHGWGQYYPFTNGTGTTWSYNAGTAGNSYFSATQFSGFKSEAGTVTNAIAGSFTSYIPSNSTLGGAIPRRGLYVLDIAKSALLSGNILRYGATGAAAHMSLDITSDDLIVALQQYTTTPVVQGTAISQATAASSMTFNETLYGGLDTVFVYWGTFAVPFQLYEIAVWRVG